MSARQRDMLLGGLSAQVGSGRCAVDIVLGAVGAGLRAQRGVDAAGGDCVISAPIL
jgi:hypothetical protein